MNRQLLDSAQAPTPRSKPEGTVEDLEDEDADVDIETKKSQLKDLLTSNIDSHHVANKEVLTSQQNKRLVKSGVSEQIFRQKYEAEVELNLKLQDEMREMKAQINDNEVTIEIHIQQKEKLNN